MTSTTTCVVVDAKMHTFPPALTPLVAVFEVVWPAVKLTLAAQGTAAAHGYTVTKPPVTGSVTATLRTTEVTSDGTRDRPATTTSRLVPPWMGAPLRVSSTRTGDMGTNRGSAGVGAGGVVGVVGVVGVGAAGATVTENDLEIEPPEFVAVIVNEYEPATVGVPVSAPVAASSPMQGGSVKVAKQAQCGAHVISRIIWLPLRQKPQPAL